MNKIIKNILKEKLILINLKKNEIFLKILTGVKQNNNINSSFLLYSLATFALVAHPLLGDALPITVLEISEIGLLIHTQNLTFILLQFEVSCIITGLNDINIFIVGIIGKALA